MELKPLGKSGINVSPLGLGTVKFGRNQQVKYPDPFSLPTDNTIVEIINLAWELGLNLIDTAPAYGNSEQRLGHLLPKHQDWIIVSKVGELFVDGQSSFDFSSDSIRTSVEASLRRLRRETIDVLLVHSDGNDWNIIDNSETFPQLEKLKEQGLIRAYGMSSKTVSGGLWTVRHCDVVMTAYNQAYTDEIAVIEEAYKLHKGVLIKKGLQSGHAHLNLGGKGVDCAFEAIYKLRGVSSVIVGTINKEHLIANVETVKKVLYS